MLYSSNVPMFGYVAKPGYFARAHRYFRINAFAHRVTNKRSSVLISSQEQLLFLIEQSVNLRRLTFEKSNDPFLLVDRGVRNAQISQIIGT